MSKVVEYRGYTIQSAPRCGADRERWGLHIVISVNDLRNVHSREFSTEAGYATEQEAEIHGIAFGQRIIDGKAEGRSVSDMKTSNRRAMPRLRVQFRAAFSNTRSKGDGVLLDLSPSGCRIESPNPVEPGSSLELYIYAPDLGWPIIVDAATVLWVCGQTFGLTFFRITEPEQQRLEKMVSILMEGVPVTGGEPAQGTSHHVNPGLEQRL
ncbi:MAG: PilZ domain-containing protein [Nitrospirota bacterium]